MIMTIDISRVTRTSFATPIKKNVQIKVPQTQFRFFYNHSFIEFITYLSENKLYLF